MGGERLDTRNPTSKLMLTILAGVATWEREIMLERQREGIAKAKAAGKYKGRPRSPLCVSLPRRCRLHAMHTGNAPKYLPVMRFTGLRQRCHAGRGTGNRQASCQRQDPAGAG
jgi:DNA invertase Pin-like site-specific DNA recombinase